MIVVLDVSAVMEVILLRSRHRDLLQSIIDAEKVITTDLYKAELASALWKYLKGQYLNHEQTGKMLQKGLSLVDEYIDISENNEEAMYEASRLNHSVYDMLYFTLARRTGATLLTLDRKLHAITLENGIKTNPI